MSQSPASASAPTEGLVDLACRSGADIRPTLLRVLTDLYVQKPVHSAEEVTQYTELAGRLIRVVDRPTLATVAGRLANYRDAPPAVMRLLNVPEAFADPALEWTSASVVVAAPSRSTQTDEPTLTDLFFTANAAERRLILVHLDAVAADAEPPVANLEGVRKLENAALKQDHRAFARELDQALHIGYTLACRVTEDPSGEPILVAAKMLGTPTDALQRILLFVNPSVGHSVQRVYDLTRLYDEISTVAAQHMVKIWREGAVDIVPRHQPVHAHEPPMRARRAATPPAHIHFDEAFEGLPPPFQIAAR